MLQAPVPNRAAAPGRDTNTKRKEKASPASEVEVKKSNAGLIILLLFTLATAQAIFKALLKGLSTFVRVR